MFDYIACAPMEGVTRAVFRRLHAGLFSGVDAYYAPFLSPSADGVFSEKELREVRPAANGGAPTVPQLLAGRAEHFIWAARRMAELGYKEVNLNLGCPSGTVVAKHKGAGLLADPGELDAFLDGVFSGLRDSGLDISVKTRIGMEDPAEFPALLAVLTQYPICRLIVHPRVRREFYKGRPHREVFGLAQAQAPGPVCYNGDVFTVKDAQALCAAFPLTREVMLGRGLVANPALARQLRGGQGLRRAELEAFHSALLEAYQAQILGEVNVLHKMKELWNYFGCLYPQQGRALKALRKARTVEQYRACANALLQQEPAADGGYFAGAL